MNLSFIVKIRDIGVKRTRYFAVDSFSDQRASTTCTSSVSWKNLDERVDDEEVVGTERVREVRRILRCSKDADVSQVLLADCIRAEHHREET